MSPISRAVSVSTLNDEDLTYRKQMLLMVTILNVGFALLFFAAAGVNSATMRLDFEHILSLSLAASGALNALAGTYTQFFPGQLNSFGSLLTIVLTFGTNNVTLIVGGQNLGVLVKYLCQANILFQFAFLFMQFVFKGYRIITSQ